MQSYTLRDLESMLGTSRSVIDGLVSAGFVSPTRGKRREYRFSFQDLVIVRTALDLRAAQISSRKIFRSLKRLRETLPDELPLSGLRISAVGGEIAVKDKDAQWQVDSGQLLLDFEVTAAAESVALLGRQPEEELDDPSYWFSLGCLFESEDAAEAEAAYRHAISKAAAYVDPYLNLGCMLCDSGRCEEAVALYRQALRHAPDEALLHFNLAVALEDMGRNEESLASYEASLALSPGFADAHYNAARLHEFFGHARKAIRHYSEYRRLENQGESE
jgi:tetratricopeptide (TPR) repeat protein